MKFLRIAAVLSTTALTTSALALTSTSASAEPAGFDQQRQELAATADAAMLDAMTETFGYTQSEALDRLAVESVAALAEPELRTQLGDTFAGLWLEPDTNTIHVAVTDEAAAVTATGFETTIVDYNAATLDKWQSAVDASDKGITSTYVDVTTNQVVIEALPQAATTAIELAAEAGIPTEAVRVETTTDTPQTYGPIVGGNPYIVNGSAQCLIGFAITHPIYGDGFVTAGHCGTVGSSVQGGSGGTGTFRGSVFPGSDHAWVDTDPSWYATNLVNRYNGTHAQVLNSNEAPVGSTVCRGAPMTGWQCGTILARNQTVSYPQGIVSGLARTDICAEPGASGGPFLSGSSAQGMTSGGSGNCSFGGTTYFSPVNPALNTYGLTLVTS